MKKIVLITGASSGIGKESAKKYREGGFIVYACARRVEKMEDLRSLGINVFEIDITDNESVIDGVNSVLKKEGKIDILVNNAGYGSYGAVEDVSLEEARRQFEVNIFGLSRIIKLVLPSMRKQNSGTIINISSVGGKIYSQFGAWYHATKHALEGFSDCLRLELKNFNINVVIIEPGLIQTEWSDIAMNNLERVSGKGPYSDECKRVSSSVRKMYSSGGSHPSVVARAIFKAGVNKRPKTRYAVGRFSKLFIFLRSVLTDKQFDFLSKFVN